MDSRSSITFLGVAVIRFLQVTLLEQLRHFSQSTGEVTKTTQNKENGTGDNHEHRK